MTPARLMSMLFSQNAMFGVFAVLFTFFCLATAILFYHWRAYTVDTKSAGTLQVTYFIVSGVLIALQVAAIFLAA